MKSIYHIFLKNMLFNEEFSCSAQVREGVSGCHVFREYSGIRYHLLWITKVWSGWYNTPVIKNREGTRHVIMPHFPLS
jgi:hypothetical protein